MLGEWARKGEIDEDVESTKTPEKSNDYDEVYNWTNKPALIFYSISLGAILFFFIPWVVGWVDILKWIF